MLQPIKTGSDFDIDKKDEKLISKILYNINTKNIGICANIIIDGKYMKNNISNMNSFSFI